MLQDGLCVCMRVRVCAFRLYDDDGSNRPACGGISLCYITVFVCACVCVCVPFDCVTMMVLIGQHVAADGTPSSVHSTVTNAGATQQHRSQIYCCYVSAVVHIVGLS